MSEAFNALVDIPFWVMGITVILTTPWRWYSLIVQFISVRFFVLLVIEVISQGKQLVLQA